MREMRIYLTGEKHSGTRCLLERFCLGYASEYRFATTKSFSHLRQVSICGENVMLEITEKYIPFHNQVIDWDDEVYYKLADGVMIVYSVDDLDSFRQVADFHDAIIRAKAASYVPCLLVGTKCDLKSERVVTYDMGENVARKIGCKFIETSATNNINVEDAFESLALEILVSKFHFRPKNDANAAVSKSCVLQ